MTADMRALFGQRLRTARQAKGVTRSQMSAQAGRHDQYIREIESGRRAITVENADRLCRILGVRLSRLLDPAIPIGAVADPCGTCQDTPPAGYRCLTCGAETRTAA